MVWSLVTTNCDHPRRQNSIHVRKMVNKNFASLITNPTSLSLYCTLLLYLSLKIYNFAAADCNNKNMIYTWYDEDSLNLYSTMQSLVFSQAISESVMQNYPIDDVTIYLAAVFKFRLAVRQAGTPPHHPSPAPHLVLHPRTHSIATASTITITITITINHHSTRRHSQDAAIQQFSTEVHKRLWC